MPEEFQPSFRLPACPACSSVVNAERPIWRLARNLSIAKGVKHWTLSGCKHAAEVAKPEKIHSDPDEIALVEEAWKHATEAMFEAKTAGWPVLQVEKFRRELDDENTLPGSTGRLRL